MFVFCDLSLVQTALSGLVCDCKRKMAPKKRMLTLKEKMEVVNLLDRERVSVRDLAKRFNIGKTQAAEITKNKEDIRSKWQSGININQKKVFLKKEGFNIDKRCFEWFVKARSQNIPISGPLVKVKAKEIATNLGYNNFGASDGWLQKWCKRHNISFKCISGEAAAVNQVDVEQFLEKLPSMLLGYKPEDVYNADESGLFFRALPNKTLSLKGEKCVGGKLSKDRLTILFCANMAGDKQDLLVIGKAARPRALKNVAIKNLPASWKSNKKAWMTREIMSEWLLQFDRKMGMQKRQVILFLDNAASHPRELKLKNVKIIFLPPNTTSVCQPLDQGIIQNFKFNYRHLILKHVLTRMEDVQSLSELTKSINVLEALYFIKTAWHKVNSSTIKNCFGKAGFRKSECNLECSVQIDYDPEEDLPLSTVAELLRHAKNLGATDPQNIEDFMNLDGNITTEEQNAVDNFSNLDEESTGPFDEGSPNDSEEEAEVEMSAASCSSNSINSYGEALNHISMLKTFARDDFTAFQHLKNLESHYENCVLQQNMARFHQTNILDFFQKPKE